MACLLILVADVRFLIVSSEVPPTHASKALDVVGMKLVAPSQGPRLTS